MRAVELLLPAGALLAALAAVAVALLRRRGARGLPREIERLLEAVPGSLGDAVLVLDGAGRIVRVNDAAGLLAAAPPAELLGRPLSALGPDLPVLAKGLARGPATALVSIAARTGPRRARAALLRVSPHADVVVLRPEAPARPPPLPRRAGVSAAAAAAPRPGPARGPPAAGALAAVAAAVRDPLGRATRAASLLRLAAPQLGTRADAALAALEEALAGAEERLAALAAVGRPGARRPLDLAAVVGDVAGALQAPGLRVRVELGPVRASGDDRALRAALREVLRALAAAIPAGEEALVSVSGGAAEPLVEFSAAIAAPAEVGVVARALLAPHGATVEEDAAAGHGWRLRIALPPVPAAQAAGSDAAFV